MKRTMFNLLLLLLAIALSACATIGQAAPASPSSTQGASSGATTNEPINDSPFIYILPEPATDGTVSVEAALANRRSHRHFQDTPLTTAQLSQILWAAYGITSPMPDRPSLRGGLRTTPSAGALYPLEIYVIVGNVEGLEPGVYRYISEDHTLERVIYGDIRAELTEAALRQRMVRDAPITLFYSAVFSRMTPRYGERGILYTYIEVGHSAQNVYLQAEALGLGTVAIGAFIDEHVREILNLPEDQEPLYLMPIGYYYMYP